MVMNIYKMNLVLVNGDMLKNMTKGLKMFNPNDYEMVEERLKKFWEQNPNGRIDTDLVVDKDAYCVFKATLWLDKDNPIPVSTGWARTMYDTNRQTKEFGLELAETSSIGRCLANYLFSGKKRSSREEMSKIVRETIKVENPADPWVTVEKPMPEPIETIQAVFAEAEEIPNCKHGQMKLKEGIGKANNRPFHGYVCTGAKPFDGNGTEDCPAIWYVIDKDTGRWVRPKGK